MTTPARRTLVALATAAALLPAAPALAQTAPPTPTPSATATPTPSATPSATATPTPAAPTVAVDRTLIDYGQTISLDVVGRAGATVQLLGNGRQIRTATIGQSGTAGFTLQPGDRTLFSAVVDGRQSASVTVEVRRTVTIGIQQPTRGIYAFTGQVARAEAGLQVTIARLDSETKRVTGIASTATDAAGRYEIRTSLPQGIGGYYALTGVTSGSLQPGRSRLYGLLVNTTPTPVVPAESISLDVGRGAGYYIFSGAVSPGRSVPVTLARVVDGRLVGVAGGRSAANGGYVFRVPVAPGTSYYQVVTATARSRVYGLVVPAATAPVVAQPPSGEPGVLYRNCDEARAAGAAPVRRGDPGYSRDLDRDGNGVGCE